MKLILLIVLAISIEVASDAHEHFTFPPHFQTAHSGMFTSDKSQYLPPDAHTPIPYFPINNMNKLPFPYLPPTATKAPFGYPSPFPILSTMRPKNNNDNDDDEDENITTPQPPYLRNKVNYTERFQNQNQRPEKARDLRPFKNFQHPIDRIDSKMPYHFGQEASTPNPIVMAPRSIIISDIQREYNMDQAKAASVQNAQYLPQPGVFISSTTETAIPILRLSNEMDLDGSFSYEALGADQTHYVQHSRMEGVGTGKDEQVVEGSYSYVGDNGKTYTVHYIADANGFRASGDHLPVPPPVPEIIQRAIQYNLAEEAKKPPHLKSWSEENQENELSESERRNRFAISPPRISNLFTGKTPESFSHGFSNTQNNLVAAASSHTPVQTTNIDFSEIQNKANAGTIAPQITFLASQGAHVPSANSPQQSMSRIFTNEKPTMPQLVNYEANLKDSDQENNKALWRWQYGINANSNQNIGKNSISRSSGIDDIVINFNDMTPEQYTQMIQQQMDSSGNAESRPQPQNNKNTENSYRFSEVELENPTTVVDVNQYSTVTPINPRQPTHQDWYNNQPEPNQYVPNMSKPKELQNDDSQTSRPKLITQEQFVPRSQTVTQTYNYDNDNFESRRSKFTIADFTNPYNNYPVNNVLPLAYGKTQHNLKSIDMTHEVKTEESVKITEPTTSSTTTSTLIPLDIIATESDIKFTDFIVNEDDTKIPFKPYITFTEHPSLTSTTTEPTIEKIFEENIFLKNLVIPTNKREQVKENNLHEDEKNLQVRPLPEVKSDKHPKHIQYQSKPLNEIKITKKKPIDVADIMNFISRNQFESNKLDLKPKQPANYFKQKNEMNYFNSESDDDDETMDNNAMRNVRTLQHQEELRGRIKNYKVLHRNIPNPERNDIDRIQRTLSPPPYKALNLPPLGRAGPSMKSYLPPIYV